MAREEQLKKLDGMAKPRSEEAIKKAKERKKQRSKLIQGLQDYFDNTSPEQLEKDLKELEKFNQYGPDIEECLELGKKHCMETVNYPPCAFDMKANELELMIGDWVCYSKANNYYTRVNEIRHTEAPLDDQWYIEGMRSDNDKINPNAVEYFTVDILSPIPLTAEILEKNGFVYKEEEETCATEAFHHWWLEGSAFALNDDSWWRSIKDDKLRVKFGIFPLIYVHELQHALRLAGIEKEIKL